jgi:hypothetical protein
MDFKHKYLKYKFKYSNLKQLEGGVSFNEGIWYYFCNIDDLKKMCKSECSSDVMPQRFKVKSQLNINNILSGRSPVDLKNIMSRAAQSIAMYLIGEGLGKVPIVGTELAIGFSETVSLISDIRQAEKGITIPYAYRLRQYINPERESESEDKKDKKLIQSTIIHLIKPKITSSEVIKAMIKKKSLNHIINYSKLKEEKENFYASKRYNQLTPFDKLPKKIILDNNLYIDTFEKAKEILNVLNKLNNVINCVCEIQIVSIGKNQCIQHFEITLDETAETILTETLINKEFCEIIMKELTINNNNLIALLSKIHDYGYGNIIHQARMELNGEPNDLENALLDISIVEEDEAEERPVGGAGAGTSASIDDTISQRRTLLEFITTKPLKFDTTSGYVTPRKTRPSIEPSIRPSIEPSPITSNLGVGSVVSPEFVVSPVSYTYPPPVPPSSQKSLPPHLIPTSSPTFPDFSPPKFHPLSESQSPLLFPPSSPSSPSSP